MRSIRAAVDKAKSLLIMAINYCIHCHSTERSIDVNMMELFHCICIYQMLRPGACALNLVD